MLKIIFLLTTSRTHNIIISQKRHEHAKTADKQQKTQTKDTQTKRHQMTPHPT